MKIIYSQADLISTLKQIENGALSVPPFQRSFDWSSNDMSTMITSIVMKDEPFGSVVVWDDSAVSDKIEQTNEVFKQLQGSNAKDNNTRKYLIDGQQRITTFAMLYLKQKVDNATGLTKGNRVYLNIKNKSNLEFIAKKDNNKNLFPAFHFFKNKEDFKIAFNDFLKTNHEGISVDERIELTTDVNGIWNKFQNINLGMVTITSDDLNAVIDVFTLINTKGKRLSIFNIVHALYVKQQNKFDLQKKFATIRKELNSTFGKDAWNIPDSVFLIVLYSIKNKTISNKKISDLAKEPSDIEDKIKYINDDVFKSVMISTIELLGQFGFKRFDKLPSNIYLYFVAYIANKRIGKKVAIDDRNKIAHLFKLGILNNRHASGQEGIKETGFIQDLEQLEKAAPHYEWAERTEFDGEDIQDEVYNGTSARSKYISAKLVANLKSFRTGDSVEFKTKENWKLNLHHIFPANSSYKDEELINSLGNITPLEFDENNDISNDEPKDYLNGTSDKSLKIGLINNNFENLKMFVEERTKEIANKLNGEWE